MERTSWRLRADIALLDPKHFVDRRYRRRPAPPSSLSAVELPFRSLCGFVSFQYFFFGLLFLFFRSVEVLHLLRGHSMRADVAFLVDLANQAMKRKYEIGTHGRGMISSQIERIFISKCGERPFFFQTKKGRFLHWSIRVYVSRQYSVILVEMMNDSNSNRQRTFWHSISQLASFGQTHTHKGASACCC